MRKDGTALKALHFLRHGELDVVQYGDVPDPSLKAGQVLVKVRACAINHSGHLGEARLAGPQTADASLVRGGRGR